MEITFLGTSFAIPTKRRNHTAILLTNEGENILVDCGEGTQRQFRKAGLNPCKITKLLITHWHGDHVFGIMGLLRTLALSGYSKTLHIYGPKGTSYKMEKIIDTFIKEVEIGLEVHEISSDGQIYDGEVVINAYKMDHGIPCVAYTIEQKTKVKMDVAKLKKLGVQGPLVGELQRGKDITYEGKKIKSKDVTFLQKGKKVAFVLDTKLNDNCVKAAKDADVLICEATYLEEDKEKAEENKHLTSAQGGEIAKKAKAKALYLTHISQRYETREDQIVKEARNKFKNSFIAQDLMRVEVKE